MLDNANYAQNSSKSSRVLVDMSRSHTTQRADELSQAYKLPAVELVSFGEPSDNGRSNAAQPSIDEKAKPESGTANGKHTTDGNNATTDNDYDKKHPLRATKIGEFGEVLEFVHGPTTWRQAIDRPGKWIGSNPDSLIKGFANFGRVRLRHGELKAEGGVNDIEKAVLPSEIDTKSCKEIALQFGQVIDHHYDILKNQSYVNQKYEPGNFQNPDGSFGTIDKDGYVSELTFANGRKLTNIKHDYAGRVQQFTDNGTFTHTRRESRGDYPIWDITDKNGTALDPTEPNRDIHFTKDGAYFAYRMKSNDGAVDFQAASGYTIHTKRDWEGALSTGWTTELSGEGMSLYKEHQGERRAELTVNTPGVSAVFKDGKAIRVYANSFPQVKDE